jgi:hypothetical protein
LTRTIFAALAAAVLGVPAFAQSSGGAWNELPDQFQVDTGYFHVSATTQLRYQGPTGSGGDVNFEQDLGIPENANTFWVDGAWRVGRRHQLKLNFTRLSRDQTGHSLTRDFTWGGQTYRAGLSTSSDTGSDILGGYYRFAIVRNDRFEIGPTLGIGYLWLNATISATASVGAASATLTRAASTGAVTGALGGYANAWPLKRLALRGDFLYIKVKPQGNESAVTDWRLGADYYFFRNAGLGVQYKYDRFRQDLATSSLELGGQLTYKGFQVFASFLF